MFIVKVESFGWHLHVLKYYDTNFIKQVQVGYTSGYKVFLRMFILLAIQWTEYNRSGETKSSSPSCNQYLCFPLSSYCSLTLLTYCISSHRINSIQSNRMYIFSCLVVWAAKMTTSISIQERRVWVCLWCGSNVGERERESRKSVTMASMYHFPPTAAAKSKRDAHREMKQRKVSSSSSSCSFFYYFFLRVFVDTHTRTLGSISPLRMSAAMFCRWGERAHRHRRRRLDSRTTSEMHD